MTKVIIKHRLFTWFEDVDSPVTSGEQVRVERISHLGDEVDIKDKLSLERGKELDAFFSDEDVKAIRKGTFDGPEADALSMMSGQTQRPPGIVSDLDNEGPQTSPEQTEGMSSQELGDYIYDNKLTVDQTTALAREGDTESIEKVYNAEDHAAMRRGNDARKGVTDRLDAMLTAATQGGGQTDETTGLGGEADREPNGGGTGPEGAHPERAQ